MTVSNRYRRLLSCLLAKHYRDGQCKVAFSRRALAHAAAAAKLVLPEDFDRFNSHCAPSKLAAPGEKWVLIPEGRGDYAFVATALANIRPNSGLSELTIRDATPGLLSLHALTEKQLLLAKVRHNRLIDHFTGLTCYPLQMAFRVALRGIGYVETDELYIGSNEQGKQYIIPVCAKASRDVQSIVQIWQDWKMAAEKFPHLACRPLSAQFIEGEVIALFEFQPAEHLLKIRAEKHYRLVPADSLTPEEVRSYREAASV